MSKLSFFSLFKQVTVLVAGLLSVVSAWATIIYSGILNTTVTSASSYTVDFNKPGSGVRFSIQNSVGSTRTLITPIASGSYVSTIASSSFSLSPTDMPYSALVQNISAGTKIIGLDFSGSSESLIQGYDSKSGLTVGYFPPASRGFIGIQLVDAKGYLSGGWIQILTGSTASPSFKVVDWTYASDSDYPSVTAGHVPAPYGTPEPPTTLLFITVLIAVSVQAHLRKQKPPRRECQGARTRNVECDCA